MVIDTQSLDLLWHPGLHSIGPGHFFYEVSGEGGKLDKAAPQNNCRCGQCNSPDWRAGSQQNCQQSTHRQAGYEYFLPRQTEFRIRVDCASPPVCRATFHEIFRICAMAWQPGHTHCVTFIGESRGQVAELPGTSRVPVHEEHCRPVLPATVEDGGSRRGDFGLWIDVIPTHRKTIRRFGQLV